MAYGFADPLIGQLLDSKYRIWGVLGSGGSSFVYDGEHVVIGRRVAIKVLHRHCAIHPALVERFEREARTAARIAHPGIIEVLDFGRLSDGIPYMVMERLDGQSLSERLSTSGAMPIAKAVDVVVEVLAAVDAAHRAGVLHRDIKPENVFLVPVAGGSERVKIADFGIAKIMDVDNDGPRLTSAGFALGTPAFMPPEQATGSPDTDGRADLYSVGVLLYELLSHRLPYEGSIVTTITKLLTEEPTPLRELAPWVPAALAEVVHKAISHDREDRFQTAHEFIGALRVFADLNSIEVGPVPLFRRSLEQAQTAAAARVAVIALPVTPRAGSARAPRPRRMLRVVSVAIAALGATLAVALLGPALLSSTPALEASAGTPAARPLRSIPQAGATAARRTSLPVTVDADRDGSRLPVDGRQFGTEPLETTAAGSVAVQHMSVEDAAPTKAEAGDVRRAHRATRPRLPFSKVY